ncbi:hypothetical protein BS78_09G213200 [Paspalum vaginatum]|nr:hypothetical protein BS78_09G213200 [Paspalum vaginatum]
MEMFSSAVISELVTTSLSFLFSMCKKKQPTATVQEDLQLLRRLLMRSDTIVEEAERRRVVSPDMLLQLKALRDKMYRGYYVLDTIRCQLLLLRGGGSSRHGGETDEEEEVKRRAFALSRFNSAKRVRFLSGDGDSKWKASAVEPNHGGGAAEASPSELRRMVCSLEAMIGGMEEFVLLLMSCPPLCRQPYSVYLSLDRCMFGRHMEKEAIMEFLLQSEPQGAGKNLGVLPIVGPTHIGKSTLVENVCHDEKVRNHFSLITVYSGNDDLRDETEGSFRDKCVIKHQNNQASEKRLLIVIEFLADVDQEAWNRLSCEANMAPGSKMIITSRSENIVRFGTTQALRLERLPVEAYWYLFRTAAFGSDDPGQHPKLASIALEMVDAMQGSFVMASMAAHLFRSNFNTPSWSRILTRFRQCLHKNASFMREHPDDGKIKDYPRITWSALKDKPDKYFMLRDIYQRGCAQEVPQISFLDLQTGRAQPPPGKYEILFLKSRIPPYFNYICTCEIRDM